MNNPWTNISKTAPYVLAEDVQQISEFNAWCDDNKDSRSKYKIDLSLPPHPFGGSLDAKVMLLNLNPGLPPSNESLSSLGLDEHFSALLHQVSERSPWSNELKNDAGAKYWRRIYKVLYGALERKTPDAGLVIARDIIVAEYFPYHSKNFFWKGNHLNSMEYTFWLVEKFAANPEKVVIGMRGKKWWQGSVKVVTGQDVKWVCNPRNPAISPGNLGKEVFGRIVDALS